jgi:uncharacterized membrane protein
MWFWYGLAAAFVGAIEVVIGKKILNKVGAPLFTWSLFTLNLPLFALLSLETGIGQLNYLFWIGTFCSSVLFVFSKTMSNQSIKRGLLSKLFPLSSLSVLFTYLFGLFILSEQLSRTAVLGIILIISGTYILNVDRAHEGLLEPFKILFREKLSLVFIFATLISSLSGIFDKLGLINIQPSNTAFALFIEGVFLSLFLLFYMIRYEKGWIRELKGNFLPLFLNSQIYGISNLLTFSGFTSGPVALTSGVKRLQILFIFLLGLWLLKDKPGKHTVLAALIMILGVILVKAG